MFRKQNGEINSLKIWGAIIPLLICIIVITMMVLPRYVVWQQGLAGKAALNKASFDRHIAVQEAQAKLESSKLLAKAEVERAKGVADANKIIGESLKENEDYLRYLWITDVAGINVNKTIVYIPTESNLPILEAGRFKSKTNEE